MKVSKTILTLRNLKCQLNARPLNRIENHTRAPRSSSVGHLHPNNKEPEHQIMSFRQSLSLKVRQLPTPHQTNGGTILGVWIFHRHGDRTPNRYLGPRHKYDEECNHWFSRIPPASAKWGDGGGAFRELSKFYGVAVSKTQNGGQFLDVGRAVS